MTYPRSETTPNGTGPGRESAITTPDPSVRDLAGDLRAALTAARRALDAAHWRATRDAVDLARDVDALSGALRNLIAAAEPLGHPEEKPLAAGPAVPHPEPRR
ncbi:hypothetical protein OG948_39725 (plasmid) [Embleya sp. NBC_00888]|uniref:hypothetical protein n=1 Tax=Embleya sp. NBC_00888 TaxID=2975960 RepID=UPI002F9157C7|nr:hypothetical protein OG948_39725 [Embleya sp. NBC_00888]